MLHVRGGMIVTAERTFRADILCGDDGRIAAIAPEIDTSAGCTVVEADGLLVMPGGIDPHTHMEMPFMGTVASEDFYTARRQHWRGHDQHHRFCHSRRRHVTAGGMEGMAGKGGKGGVRLFLPRGGDPLGRSGSS